MIGRLYAFALRCQLRRLLRAGLYDSPAYWRAWRSYQILTGGR